jgi:hypothetical protein
MEDETNAAAQNSKSKDCTAELRKQRPAMNFNVVLASIDDVEPERGITCGHERRIGPHAKGVALLSKWTVVKVKSQERGKLGLSQGGWVVR